MASKKLSTMRSTSSMRKSLFSLAIFWTNSDRIISFPYIYLTRVGKTRAIRSLPAPMRVDPSQRGREITMNQGGVKIYRVDEKGPQKRKEEERGGQEGV